MRISLLPLLALVAAAPAAWALTAAEAQKTFFGYDMAGYVQDTKEKWHECIRPTGATSYWFAGGYDEGRLRVRDDGRLCFSYKSTGYQREACFTSERVGRDNWRFTDEADPTTVFVTTRTRSVKSCPTNEAPIS